jgi:hypothetical protein
MILLKATIESLTITTSTAATVDYSVSYADITTTTFLPSTNEGTIAAASTVTLLLAPAASTQRQVKLISITNHDVINTTIAIKKLITATSYALTPVATLLAGETMQYVDGQGWVYYASNGSVKGTTLNAAGVDKSIQFNDGGTALGADADLTFNKTNSWLGVGTSSGSGAIALGANTTDQPASPANQIYIYAKQVATKMIPKWIGPAGIDNPIQPGLGFNGIKQVAPAVGTTATTCMTAFATAFTNTATTIVQVPVTSGSIKTIMRSVTLATSATAGTLASHFNGQYEVCGFGGYFFASRFYVSGTLQAGQLGFHGLAGRTAIFTTALGNPTTEATIAKVGLGYALAGTVGNWRVCAATGSAVLASVDTGIAVNITDVMELVLFCAPNSATIGYRVTNLTSTVTVSGTISGNVPPAATPLAVHQYVSNNTTAGIATFGLNKWYLESDY